MNGHRLSRDDMIERYAEMAERYPIRNIEDTLGESDRDGWRKLTARLGGRVQLVGDDNLCTLPSSPRPPPTAAPALPGSS